MKKIVLITEVMEKGVAKHIIDLYSIFSKDKDVEMLVLHGGERVEPQFLRLIEKNRDKFIKIKSLKRTIGIDDIKSIVDIKKILKEFKPDIVHCHSSKAGLAGRIAAKLARVKKVYYSPHAYFFLKYQNKSVKRFVFLFAEKILSKFFTTYTIATSKGEEEAFIKNRIDKEKKCILIEHGVQVPYIDNIKIEQYKEEYKIDKNKTIVGAMARLEPQKDPVTTIKTMENIIQGNDNVICILFGNGSMHDKIIDIYENMQDLCREKIIIAGETEKPEISIAMMDIYLTTSLYEGLPYTLLTALGYNKPIIATNVEGNKDCVKNGLNGFLFEKGDYKQAAEYCEKIIKQKELMLTMKKESENIFKQRFSTEQMKYKYQKLYMEE